jgi:hypothetical protein
MNYVMVRSKYRLSDFQNAVFRDTFDGVTSDTCCFCRGGRYENVFLVRRRLTFLFN